MLGTCGAWLGVGAYSEYEEMALSLDEGASERRARCQSHLRSGSNGQLVDKPRAWGCLVDRHTFTNATSMIFG